jgi:hypothetical protein
MKKQIIKSVLTIALLVVLNLVLGAYEPVISSQFAVQQLNDSYDSNANLTIYQNLKNWSWLAYILIPVIVFFKDIKKLFVNTKTNN